ncbi:apolipoprotein N-acyltransferase [Granulicella tundricola]|uniref:Apolipoprotein N-acyltransferase n=1 Tax=Granulicella tundricola (strain ATCC BAA-1859 / DSM 23138 / MP5ACTX9) TaxID=1198114 RepID=E8X4K6_GRATM|nr:apolipoprotein N-acyltransferase [Granulicella tundricola]ADW69416.1 apolipoprotein N-acyltransferase [Granulicella tundricola MP5ACTX9]
MRSIRPQAWILVVFSAILQTFCFPVAGQISFSRAGICWFALVPFFIALLIPDKSGKSLRPLQGAALGYLCGVLWYVGNCSWIYQTMYLYGGMEKPVAFLILILFALYLGLYHALFALLLTFFRGRFRSMRNVLLLAPVLWVAVELARARVTGFPWDLLGNALIDHAWMTKLAPLGGVMLMSFVVAMANACFTGIALKPGSTWYGKCGSIVTIAYFLQLTGTPGRTMPSAGNQTAVMVQENLSVGATSKSEKPLTREYELQQFSELSLHPQLSSVLSGQRQQATVVVWPEAPAHLQTNDPAFRAAMSDLARRANAPVIAGSLGVDFDNKPARGYYLYDSAALFDKSGSYQGRYDKIHLVPWGEYIPYKQFFSFAQKLTEGAGDMDPGTTRSVFTTNGHTYGVFVCYESIFGDEVRQFVKSGAEVLVNISDDGWYGDTGAPWQHLNMARMRAIENRRWVLRSTNTGMTTAIDPYGRYTETPRHVRVAYALPFAFESGLTFYTRHGDWFAYLCAVVALAAVGFSLKPRMN